MVENNYDENGEITLRDPDFQVENWLHPGEYAKIVTKASPMQKVGLVLSFGIFAGFAAYSYYLTKKLYNRMPWRPPKSVLQPYSSGAEPRVMGAAQIVAEAGRVSRVNSGIVAMRTVTSGGSRSRNGIDYSAMMENNGPATSAGTFA